MCALVTRVGHRAEGGDGGRARP